MNTVYERATVCVITILVVVLLVSCTSLGISGSTMVSADELLSLGEKYLLELDFEQALVQFLSLIEIEPKNPRGYTGAAEAYVGLGNEEKAIEVLRRGLDILPDDLSIKLLLERLERSNSELAQLAEQLIDLYATAGYEAVIELMHGDIFNETVVSALAEADYKPIIINESSDIGCGFYFLDDAVYVYLGSFDGQLRAGEGIWLNVESTGSWYYAFIGEWSKDMPNGRGEEIIVYDESRIEKEEDYDYALKITTTGTFSNGLANGAVNKRWAMDDGHTHNWNLTAENGHYKVVGNTDWSDAVVGFCTECDADLTDEFGERVRGLSD